MAPSDTRSLQQILFFAGSFAAHLASQPQPRGERCGLPTGFCFGNSPCSMSTPSARGKQPLCQGTLTSGCALGWECLGANPESLPAATMTCFPQIQGQPHHCRLRNHFLSHAKDFSKLLCFLYHFLPSPLHFLFFLPLSPPPPHLSSHVPCCLRTGTKRGALIIMIS